MLFDRIIFRFYPMSDYPRYTPEEEDRIIEDAYAEVLQAYLRSNHRKKVEIIEKAK